MKKSFKALAALTLCLSMAASLMAPAWAAPIEEDTDIPKVDAAELKTEWKQDQDFTLADPAPWNLNELKQVVEVTDPRSVAAYWVWSVNRLADNYDDGMAMMKYLFADIEPYGSGYTEGGMSGRAGWDTYLNERLKDPDYKWLPRAYFEGADKENGMVPDRPLTIELYYNDTNTETINAQTLDSMGRLNIVYWVQSHAGGHQVNITLSKFAGTDRWYVTNGTASSGLFYDQRSALTMDQRAAAGSAVADPSTAAKHAEKYGGTTPEPTPEPDPTPTPEPTPEPDPTPTPEPDPTPVQANPFTDVSETDVCYDAVLWAYYADPQVTKGVSDTKFGPEETVTRGQCVTFLWRAMGCPEPQTTKNPFVDVNSSEYWYKPILWAMENGVTVGVDSTHFAPKATLSTRHIITFLYRTLNPGQGGPAGGWNGEAADWAGKSYGGKPLGVEIAVNDKTPCPRWCVVQFLYVCSK